MESGKTLIVTTNLFPQSIAGTDDATLQRLCSRLASLHPVSITGTDRCKAEKKRRYEEINDMPGIENKLIKSE